MTGLDAWELTGRTLGSGWFIEQVVGRTECGTVYRAHDGQGKAGAIHTLNPPVARDPLVTAQAWNTFRREADALVLLTANEASIAAPRLIDAVTTPGDALLPYVVFEWVEGQPLALKAERGDASLPQSLRDWVFALTPMVEALARVHLSSAADGRSGACHLALAPEHLSWVESASGPAVKLLGLGLSGALGALGGDAFAVRCAPEGYRAPEQCLAPRYGGSGGWTDVWALALTVSRLYARRTERPVRFDHPSGAQAVCSPRALGADASDAVEAVFRRALAVDPRQRHPHVGVFWMELQRALADRADASQNSGLRLFEQPDQEAVMSLELALESPRGAPSVAAENNRPEGAAEPNDALRVGGPVVVQLRPRRSARVRHLAARHGPPFICASSAVAVAVAGQWFASRSGDMPKFGPLPLSVVVVFLIGLLGVQVMRGLGRR